MIISIFILPHEVFCDPCFKLISKVTILTYLKYNKDLPHMKKWYISDELYNNYSLSIGIDKKGKTTVILKEEPFIDKYVVGFITKQNKTTVTAIWDGFEVLWFNRYEGYFNVTPLLCSIQVFGTSTDDDDEIADEYHYFWKESENRRPFIFDLNSFSSKTVYIDDISPYLLIQLDEEQGLIVDQNSTYSICNYKKALENDFGDSKLDMKPFYDDDNNIVNNINKIYTQNVNESGSNRRYIFVDFNDRSYSLITKVINNQFDVKLEKLSNEISIVNKSEVIPALFPDIYFGEPTTKAGITVKYRITKLLNETKFERVLFAYKIYYDASYKPYKYPFSAEKAKIIASKNGVIGEYIAKENFYFSKFKNFGLQDFVFFEKTSYFPQYFIPFQQELHDYGIIIYEDAKYALGNIYELEETFKKPSRSTNKLHYIGECEGFVPQQLRPKKSYSIKTFHYSNTFVIYFTLILKEIFYELVIYNEEKIFYFDK